MRLEGVQLRIESRAGADVVQDQRMVRLTINHRHDMADHTEQLRQGPVLSSEVIDDSGRYPYCNMGMDRHCMFRRRHDIFNGFEGLPYDDHDAGSIKYLSSYAMAVK